jgi:hypothetical protein
MRSSSSTDELQPGGSIVAVVGRGATAVKIAAIRNFMLTEAGCVRATRASDAARLGGLLYPAVPKGRHDSSAA